MKNFKRKISILSVLFETCDQISFSDIHKGNSEKEAFLWLDLVASIIIFNQMCERNSVSRFLLQNALKTMRFVLQ